MAWRFLPQVSTLSKNLPAIFVSQNLQRPLRIWYSPNLYQFRSRKF